MIQTVSQISDLSDSFGLPTGFNQNIYRDIDAALELARKYDLYYHFTLNSSVSAEKAEMIRSSIFGVLVVTTTNSRA